MRSALNRYHLVIRTLLYEYKRYKQTVREFYSFIFRKIYWQNRFVVAMTAAVGVEYSADFVGCEALGVLIQVFDNSIVSRRF